MGDLNYNYHVNDYEYDHLIIVVLSVARTTLTYFILLSVFGFVIMNVSFWNF